jgi:peroxiredoxin
VVTTKLGVLNLARGNMAHPTTLVVDRLGKVRFVEEDVDFSKRPSAATLLGVLKTLKE